MAVVSMETNKCLNITSSHILIETQVIATGSQIKIKAMGTGVILS